MLAGSENNNKNLIILIYIMIYNGSKNRGIVPILINRYEK